MPTVRKVTLNKAAIMLKKIKEKTNEDRLFNNMLNQPIDAISGRQPSLIRSQILTCVDEMKKQVIEKKDAILLYSNIKETIIDANVRSGLHQVLCQIDMMKEMKKYLEEQMRFEASKTVQECSLSSRGVQYLLVKEEIVNDVLLFNNLVDDIINDITRQDSKNSYVNAVIAIEEHDSKYIKEALVEITKSLNVLEDKKYEINNSYKIEVLVPDSLYETLGIPA